MSPYCPRCEVQFDKDLPRCLACGWDFHAYDIPANFLKPPIDYAPLREFGLFIRKNWALIWINGLTVEALWVALVYMFYRSSYNIWTILLQGTNPSTPYWILGFAIVLATILFYPIHTTYLYGLMRRYRYHVPVQLFWVFAPFGRSRYSDCIGWAPVCMGISAVLSIFFIVPGVVFLMIVIPFLMLMNVDKMNVSMRRSRFILGQTFKRLPGVFILSGFVLTILWMVILLVALMGWMVGAVVLGILFFPVQSVYSVLLYESLLGRSKLD
jgi:hypothetical protein